MSFFLSVCILLTRIDCTVLYFGCLFLSLFLSHCGLKFVSNESVKVKKKFKLYTEPQMCSLVLSVQSQHAVCATTK